jgi:hypothetical protein
VIYQLTHHVHIGYVAPARPGFPVDKLQRLFREDSAGGEGPGWIIDLANSTEMIGKVGDVCPNIPIRLAVPELRWWDGADREAYGPTDSMEICWPGELL